MYEKLAQKLYYSIGEVSEILDISKQVLRYWESEFQELRIKRDSARRRIYTKKNIELFALIKKLTHEDKLSIKEVKQHIRKARSNKKKYDKDLFDEKKKTEIIDFMRKELREIASLLK